MIVAGTLSISGCDRFERDSWLRAFFGEHLAHVWASPPKTGLGHECGVTHWRLFCDAQLQQLVPDANEADLIAGGLRRASDYGVAPARAGLAA
jgi:hypothetical protein